MRKQCVPGSLSPPPREPGHEAKFHRTHVLLTIRLVARSMLSDILRALCMHYVLLLHTYIDDHSNPVILRVYRKSMVYIGWWCHCTRSIWSSVCNILLTVHTVSCSTCTQMLYTYMILCEQCGHRPMNNTT